MDEIELKDRMIYIGESKPQTIFFSEINDPEAPPTMKVINFRFVWLNKMVCWFLKKLGFKVYWEPHMHPYKNDLS